MVDGVDAEYATNNCLLADDVHLLPPIGDPEKVSPPPLPPFWGGASDQFDLIAICGFAATGAGWGQSAVSAHPARVWLPFKQTHRQVIGIGLNYRKHAVESGMAIPEEPLMFTKVCSWCSLVLVVVIF